MIMITCTCCPSTICAVARDLRKHIWGQEEIAQNYPPLQRDIRCDVCVIGGGVCGLSTAYRLAKA